MPAFKPLILVLGLLCASLTMSAQIRDSLLYLTNGLALDSRPNLNQYRGVKFEGDRLVASQTYHFVEMKPASPNDWEGSILYLLHEDYKGRMFDAPSLNTGSQKAAVFVLDCESQEIRIQQENRRLYPPQGCEFSRYTDDMTLKGKRIIVIPKY